MTPADFIRARLDEREAQARVPVDHDRIGACDHRAPHEEKCGYDLFEGLSSECRCGYPARVLRQVAALRAVVERHKMWSRARGPAPRRGDTAGDVINPEQLVWWCGECEDGGGMPYDHDEPWCATHALLADIWSDHPDCDPAWSVAS